MVLWFAVVIIVMVTITKFMFICVWKSMRTMNDDLMVRIAVNQALLSSIVLGLHTYLHTHSSQCHRFFYEPPCTFNSSLIQPNQFYVPYYLQD